MVNHEISGKGSGAFGRPTGAIEDIQANAGKPGRCSRALHAPVPQVLHDNNGQSVARESGLRVFLTSSCDFISLRPRSARKEVIVSRGRNGYPVDSRADEPVQRPALLREDREEEG
jgi:hypothetical protein